MKLINGSLAQSTLINGVKVTISSKEHPPFPVEVMILEEDTNLILSDSKEILYEEIHPIRLMTEIMNAKKHKPGSVVANRKNWYAIVIDVNANIMCQSSWVSAAYSNVFECLEYNRVSSAGIHLLGNYHGKIPVRKAMKLFLEGIKTKPTTFLKHIWLIVPELDIKTAQKKIVEHK